ncbi:MAG TPA: hypothetical protein VLV83_14890 [Acidobacteriota bacterium]|nr:hypothetical protein [Acidobacteriota bacterium]
MSREVTEAVSGLDFKEAIGRREASRIVGKMVKASKRLKAVCQAYMDFFDSRLGEFEDDLDLFEDLDQILATLGYRIRQFERAYEVLGNSIAEHYGYGEPDPEDVGGTGKPWPEESTVDEAQVEKWRSDQAAVNGESAGDFSTA